MLIPFHIREAMYTDVAILSDLGRRTFFETYASYNTPENMVKYVTENFSVEALEQELNEEKNSFFLISNSQTAIGYAKMRKGGHAPEINGNCIEIERIYILREFQGLKAGAALIRHCIKYAASRECDIIWLGVWENNLSAIGFYEGQGFHKCGMHNFILGEDEQVDYLMVRQVRDSEF
jgi:ribosomal protein S18 acetylase RimI-like enzyme